MTQEFMINFCWIKKIYNITLEQCKDYDFQKCGNFEWNDEEERYELDHSFSYYFDDKQIIPPFFVWLHL